MLSAVAGAKPTARNRPQAATRPAVPPPRNPVIWPALWAVMLWWGSLTTVGFAVVPLLFVHAPSPALAGQLAAKLFTAQSWAGVALGLLVLWLLKPNQPIGGEKRGVNALFFVIFAMLCALLLEFAAAPRILARQDLRLWHSVGSALYGLQWLAVTALLHRLLRGWTVAAGPGPNGPGSATGE